MSHQPTSKVAAPCHEDSINVLTATATELQEKLSNSTLKSTDLVRIYLKQIEDHNHNGLQLNAVISTPPVDQVLAIARNLDNERTEGHTRGPLHGIPILLKDNIMTGASMQMDTTCGAYAFLGAKAKKNAPIVDMVLDAGMIIIGRTNLSEWAGFKGHELPGGLSAVGGQTQTPYVVGGFIQGDRMIGHSNCCGSSSGSAVGVAAGFAPFAIGTEDNGSIVQPCGRSSLYGLKITVGDVSTEGTSPLSPFTDSLGPMARCAEDLAASLGILLQRDFSSSLTKTWKGLRVGFVDPKTWYIREGPWDFIEEIMNQQVADILDAMNLIAQGGGKVVQDISLISYDELQFEGLDGLDQIWNHDFAHCFTSFVQGYVDPPVRSVEDMIAFNIRNAEKALPGDFEKPQGLLEDSIKKESHLTVEKYHGATTSLREKARVEGYEKAFREYDVDIIAGPLDSRLGSIAAVAGFPSATVPLGYAESYNGRAYGLSIIAGARKEEKLVQFMSAWNESHPELPKPPPMFRGV
ncbi:hypothetical protein N7528_010089 [Penicillium herquei]|nr:hypothetical protein N7528_010089 [Penicillium herquei]